MEWKPIETAPKDGTRFIGWNKAHGMHECFIPENVGHYKRVTAIYGTRTTSTSCIWFSPTHWQPLLPPPEKEPQWEPIETAPKYGEDITLLQDGIQYEGYEWFEGAWALVHCDQAGPYVFHRLKNPTHWKLS